MPGSDVEARLPLTLEEAHGGGTRTITIEGTKTLEVTIPAGVRDGTLIRLTGQGQPGSDNARPGGLFLRVHIKPHPLFSVVDKDDIQIELPVAPWEAALGAKVRVPTLDEAVEMTIAPGTQSGLRLRLRGQGLNRKGGGRGNEYVKLKIVNPPKFSAKEKELFEKLAAESDFDAREHMGGKS